MLTLKQYGEKIWAILGDTRAEVALSFMRFQEYYENPVYKGKKGFTIQDINDWQATISHKPYEDCWAGFNIPGQIFLKVATPLFVPFSEKEQALIELVHANFTDEQIADMYFIGASPQDDDFEGIMMHEVGHGLFKTNASYHTEQVANLASLPFDIHSVVREILLEQGYCEDVIEDEMHAYLMTDADYLLDRRPDVAFHKYSQPFIDTYKKYVSNNSVRG